MEEGCADPEVSDELGMGHVGGVFLVLLVGCVCGIFIGILEFLWNVRNVAIEKQVSVNILLFYLNVSF